MTEQTFKHWHWQIDEENIMWLALDREGASVNSLSREVFSEFDAIIDEIKALKPEGVALYSAKDKGFIAGADITQFTSLETPEEAFDLIRQAQIVLDKLEALPMPTVAMIDGFCLGGGLEVSLACRYRIARDDDKTVLGLPEVKLGIHPGWGGTVRLPRLIGAVEAMKIMLPGRAVKPKVAKQLGLVDAAVPLRELKRAARYYILHKPRAHTPRGAARFSNHPWVRPILGKMFYKGLAAKHVIKAHYPAPFAIVRNWIRDGAKGQKAMLNEAKSIAKLMLHPTSRHLVRVFFLQERMKSLAKGVQFNPQHVHVIGGGTMGGDIAAWCALRGLHVTLQDQTPDKIAPAIKRAYKLFKKKLKQPRLIQAAMDRLQPDITGMGVKRADIVIEAIFENLEAKQLLFKAIEPHLKPDAVLATNTSSIPLEEISTILKDPARLVGVHFFNPVAQMMLVEVVKGTNTSDEVIQKAMSFVGKIGRLPLPVRSHPGFLVNRILIPYMMEAMALYEEGVSPKVIDRAAVKFGMPMGPITLADTVGLDICLSVSEKLKDDFNLSVPAKLRELVEAKRLGVKSGHGFYQYQNGKQVKMDEQTEQKKVADIQERLILRMINEAVACLDEKIVEDADLLDGGMIFGTGFAPFRGGPMKYCEDTGFDQVHAELLRLEKQYGERFKPVAGWGQFVKSKPARTPPAKKTPAKKTAAKPAKKKAAPKVNKPINKMGDEAASDKLQ